jgi:hypothetical protein
MKKVVVKASTLKHCQALEFIPVSVMVIVRGKWKYIVMQAACVSENLHPLQPQLSLQKAQAVEDGLWISNLFWQTD